MEAQEINKAGEQIGLAVYNDDPITAGRLLDQLGACGWKAAANDMKASYKHSADKLFGTGDLIVSESLNGLSETITLSQHDDTQTGHAVIPVISVTEPRCQN